jgi:hypothetical protein
VDSWLDTTPDPEIARVVAQAEAEARKEVPPADIGAHRATPPDRNGSGDGQE